MNKKKEKLKYEKKQIINQLNTLKKIRKTITKGIDQKINDLLNKLDEIETKLNKKKVIIFSITTMTIFLFIIIAMLYNLFPLIRL